MRSRWTHNKLRLEVRSITYLSQILCHTRAISLNGSGSLLRESRLIRDRLTMCVQVRALDTQREMLHGGQTYLTIFSDEITKHNTNLSRQKSHQNFLPCSMALRCCPARVCNLWKRCHILHAHVPSVTLSPTGKVSRVGNRQNVEVMGIISQFHERHA